MAERFGNDLVLLERIAAGGMAEVYRAKQIGLAGFQKTIALKRILPNYAMNEEFKSMFRAEANLSGMLAHQNVVQIFQNGEFNDYLYLTMEFVDGKNARQILARADKKKIRIPIELSIYIIAEAAKGLDYAHNFVDEKSGQPLEIVHRDMSPQNMMVSYDGAIKIVDFGIAKAAARSGQTKAGVLKGKFGYMSPEQATGLTLDRRTDIFAMGIILFELLTQRRLFTSDDDLKTLQLVKDCRVPRPSKYNPDVSPALDTIVLKALKKEKSERYSNAGELYADLTRYLSQKYNKFLPTDLSKFVRELFAEDIIEEKKKRDKANAEMYELPELQAMGTSNRSQSVKMIPTTTPVAPLTVDASKDKIEGPDEVTKNTGAYEEEIKTDLGKAIAKNAAAKTPSKKETVNENSQLTPAPSFSKSATGLRYGGEKVDVQKESATLPPPQLVAKNSFDADKMRAQLQRPIKMAPPQKTNSNKISPLAIVAGLVLVFGALWYFTQGSNSGDSQVAKCEGTKIAWPKDSKICMEKDSICGDGKSFDAESYQCVAATIANTPQCVLGLIWNPATKSCQAKSSLCKAPEVFSEETQACVNQEVNRTAASVMPWPKEPFAPAGFLNLNSVPRADKIFINGSLLQDLEGNQAKTPVKSLRLKPGKYRIRLENGFYGWNREQSISIENSRTLDIDFSK